MVRRSVLFSPGDRPELLRKAPGLGADVVVFDLEDAVAPGRKDEARAAVGALLSDPAFDPDCEVCVRVNPVGGAAGADVAGISGPEVRLDSVMLPKAERGADVDTLVRLLEEHDLSAPVIALVESATGLLHAAEIAAADATDAVAFGAEDYAADVGANRTAEGVEVLYAREHVIAAATAAGVEAIDTPYTDIEDEAGLREEARHAVDLGFDGKLCIHPAQVEPVHAAFTPAEEDVRWARKVIEARREADVDDRGVFRVEGEMIDAPLVARAERILDRAGDGDV